MKIYKPELVLEGDNSVIKVLYETNEEQNYLWYSLPKNFSKYIVTKNADTFFIGLLLLIKEKKFSIGWKPYFHLYVMITKKIIKRILNIITFNRYYSLRRA